MTELHTTLRKTVEVLLRLMGFSDATVEVMPDTEGEGLLVAIESRHAHLLIGEYGMHLRAFEYVAKLVARRTLPDPPRFFVDINRYRQGRIEYLRGYAKDVANRVTRSGREIPMQPMSSYERRIVHLELMSRPDVTTESIGEEPERWVVVKPY